MSVPDEGYHRNTYLMKVIT